MDDKNNSKNFIKWYIKYFIISILVGIIVSGILYSIITYESKEERYYYNYYEINRKELNIIKDYINKNNLKGAFTSNSIYYNEGNLYNKCIKNKECYIGNIYFTIFLFEAFYF